MCQSQSVHSLSVNFLLVPDKEVYNISRLHFLQNYDMKRCGSIYLLSSDPYYSYVYVKLPFSFYLL